VYPIKKLLELQLSQSQEL